jgi:ureidoglycolate lyase
MNDSESGASGVGGLELGELSYVPTIGPRQVHETPVVLASDETLAGYGCTVEDPHEFPVEIVRWPARGWRPIDENSGDQGGVTEGSFELWWRGDTLFAHNHAVGDSYLFAWSTWPDEATDEPAGPRERALVWRANYHPDGGQLFHPRNGERFVVPLALPGDHVEPGDFVAFLCDGTRGLYVHPDVWHGPILPLDDRATLLDRQGRVHARVSVDFPKEFGCYLSVPLTPP